ncbi:phage holin family protein [Candidatus Azambacteria bacterium]|nr:phage holin family protein [Candidatus Azambacteria bacterium]
MRFLFQVFSNALAILAADHFVEGFHFTGDFLDLLKVGLVLGTINFVIKPVVKFFTWPVILITFGLFLLLINAFLLWIADQLLVELSIDGLLPLFLATIVLGLANFLIKVFAKGFERSVKPESPKSA